MLTCGLITLSTNHGANLLHCLFQPLHISTAFWHICHGRFSKTDLSVFVSTVLNILIYLFMFSECCKNTPAGYSDFERACSTSPLTTQPPSHLNLSTSGIGDVLLGIWGREKQSNNNSHPCHRWLLGLWHWTSQIVSSSLHFSDIFFFLSLVFFFLFFCFLEKCFQEELQFSSAH